MTAQAQLALGLGKKAFRIGRMRIVAAQAFPFLGRRMFEFGAFGKRIMALHAQGLARLHQEKFVGRFMRIMAGGALAIAHRLMHHFLVRQKIVMTLEAHLLLRPLEPNRVFGLVTFAAFVIAEGRV